LLNEDGEIDREFYKVFNELMDMNVKFVVASGRQYHQLLKNFEDVGDNIIYIAENGTMVRYMDREIYSCTLNPQDVKRIVEQGKKIHGICMVLCGKNSAYISTNDEKMVEECKKYYYHLEIVDDLSKVEDDILKIAILDFDKQENTYNQLKQNIEDNLQVIISGQIWIDIYRKEVNKGVALRLIQERFNIKKEETMAFGDYFNDVEMLNEAYYSYAMANAPEGVKEHARFIAKSNIENGVIEAIKEIVLKPMNKL
jgi:Cof subfamily protein (haloacid dehalogenase superfamily)